MTKKKLLLGAHQSIAGGYEQAIIKADEIGCSALQIFTKSGRQWAAKPITTEQALLFKDTFNSSSCNVVVAHASYLINIASADDALRQKSILALKEELHRCHALGIPYLVLHPGNFTRSTLEESLYIAHQSLSIALEQDKGHTMILLENTAGQGSSIGFTFEQLASITQDVTPRNRIGFCFDTCHGFAAGYSFSTKQRYEDMWNKFDALIGLHHIKTFHCNDSAKGLGSRVDRHAHIGEGAIGIEAFRLLMNDSRFFDIPKILETPKSATDLSDDVKNMNTLKNLLSEETKTILNIA